MGCVKPDCCHPKLVLKYDGDSQWRNKPVCLLALCDGGFRTRCNSPLILIGQTARKEVVTPGKAVVSQQISVWGRQESAVCCSSIRVTLKYFTYYTYAKWYIRVCTVHSGLSFSPDFSACLRSFTRQGLAHLPGEWVSRIFTESMFDAELRQRT